VSERRCENCVHYAKDMCWKRVTPIDKESEHPCFKNTEVIYVTVTVFVNYGRDDD